jgi:glycosyltransferase 2 family protein
MHVTIKKGLGIFCGITVLSICLLIIFTTDLKTLHALRFMNPRYLFLSFFFICLSWCFDALRLRILTRVVGTKLSFMYGIRAVLAYTFLSNITPSSAGGEPLLFYMLNQKGVSFGKATAITFLRTMITMVFFVIGGPIIIYFHRELLSSTSLKMVFDYVAIFMVVTMFFFAYLYFAPTSARRWLNVLFRWLGKIPFFKGRSSRIKQGLLQVVDEFKSSLGEFIQDGRWQFLLVIFFTAMMIMSQFLVAPMILKGLGCDVKILSTFMLQGVLNFMLYYIPTPGGSGVSEGVGYALFAPSVPTHLMGIFLVIWRFLTNYIWTIVGGLLIVKTLGMQHLEEITRTSESVSQTGKPPH